MEHRDEENVRQEKLENLAAQGVAGYPATSFRENNIAAVLTNFSTWQASEKKVCIAGRLMTVRGHGGSTFADLQDASGRIQLHLRKDVLDEDGYNLFRDNIDHGDFLEITGNLILTKVGQQTVEVTGWRLLTKALLPLPDKFHGLQDVELRYRERYLDLIANPEAWRIALLRPQVVRFIRDFLHSEGFVEVETPILQEQAGGANARPFVTHHNALNLDLLLRIAPELHLKRLVVGGMEKVFEVARCFRNEGIDHAHNPEFTQVEFYWAYATYEDLMRLSERLISELVELVHGKKQLTFRGQEYDFTPPWPRLTFRQAVLDRAGIDIDNIQDEEKLREIISQKKIAGVDLSNCVGYAEVMDELYKRAVRPHLAGPLLLLDYPIEMVPLAKRTEADPSKAATVQLVVAGMEVFKGYNELNDPLVQEARLIEQRRLAERGSEESMPVDQDFIKALKQGMPPTAGWGMGIDRLMQILVDAPNLKEVILFPTLRPPQE